MLTKPKLLKRIRLLFLEAQIENAMGNSLDGILEEIADYKQETINEENISLIDVIKEMRYNDFSKGISKELFELGLSIALPHSEDIIKSTLTLPDTDDGTMREINMLRSIFKEDIKVFNLQTKLFNNIMTIKKDYKSITNINEFLAETKELIDKNNPTRADTSAIMDEVDMTNSDSIQKVLDRVQEESKATGVWKTYLTGINDMTQGGLRPGLTFVLGSQFNFKSGLTLSLFCSCALLNPPKPSDRAGKPTMVWISFEDPMVKVIGDVYGILKSYDDPNCERINLEDIDMEIATAFIKKKFDSSGYDVRCFRIDPSNYSYSALFDFLTTLELQGASLRFVGIDYIAHIPKTGCSRDGATGADTRELIRRIRNWLEARGIPGISPHQISSAGNQLKKDGISDQDFVAKVADKGYTADSAQINQEYDLEIVVNKWIAGESTYLNVGRGKHKLNSVIDDMKKLNFHVKFPDNGNKIAPDVLEGQERACFHFPDDVVKFNKKAEETTLF
jgi:hypothetical protein